MVSGAKAKKPAKPNAGPSPITVAAITQLQSRVSRLESEISSLQNKLDDVLSRTVDPATLMVLDDLRYKLACDSVKGLIEGDTLSLKNLIARSPLSLVEVEATLKEWGLDLNDKEIIGKIIDSTPRWIEEKSFRVPTSEAVYSKSGIVIFPEGQEMRIPAQELPFKTSSVLEGSGVKGLLEGTIKGIRRQEARFAWDKRGRNLKIVRGDFSYDVIVEDDFLSRIKYVDPPHTWDSFIGGSVIVITPKHPGRRPSKKAKYDRECIRFLKGLVTKKGGYIYLTPFDLWVRLGDILIWEEPKYSKATYIFGWPKDPLPKFIAKVWKSKLIAIRTDPKSGYRDRAVHDYRNKLAGWKAKIAQLDC